MKSLVFALLLFAAQSPVEYGFDRHAIDWVLPANFPQALERSLKEQRILLIKAVAFNIDEAGAKCATKGNW